MTRYRAALLFLTIALAALLTACSGSVSTPARQSSIVEVVWVPSDRSGTLTLEEDFGSVSSYRDSGPLTRNNGNPWKEIGFWTAKPKVTHTTNEICIWRSSLTVAPANVAADADKTFDLKVDLYVNGDFAGSGISYKKEKAGNETVVIVGSWNHDYKEDDILQMRVSARMGTDGFGAPADSYPGSGGVRMLFGSPEVPSRLELSSEPFSL